MAADYATEWNAVYLPLETFKERNALLDEYLKERGREPSSVKRSLMTGTVFARDDAGVDAAVAARTANSDKTFTADDLRERGLIVGTPSMWVDQLGALVEAGVERFMLQWLELDDIDGLEILARDVLPQFH
jgi:alkanesulfonate monooxygenase SsuD/methylene tetrahydromethanopterin reductase-like flavin-dependent oxidoreductase (luciferase family)